MLWCAVVPVFLLKRICGKSGRVSDSFAQFWVLYKFVCMYVCMYVIHYHYQSLHFVQYLSKSFF